MAGLKRMMLSTMAVSGDYSKRLHNAGHTADGEVVSCMPDILFDIDNAFIYNLLYFKTVNQTR